MKNVQIIDYGSATLLVIASVEGTNVADLEAGAINDELHEIEYMIKRNSEMACCVVDNTEACDLSTRMFLHVNCGFKSVLGILQAALRCNTEPEYEFSIKL